MKNNYWENETPVVADTGAVVLRHYRNAGRLQIAVKYVDATGITKQGKAVTLNVERVRDNPTALDIFREVVAV